MTSTATRTARVLAVLGVASMALAATGTQEFEVLLEDMVEKVLPLPHTSTSFLPCHRLME